MKITKILAVILAVCMVLSVAVACGDTTPNNGNNDSNNNNNANDTNVDDNNEVAIPDPVDIYADMTHAEASEAIYDKVLGEFLEYYEAASDASSVSEKFAYMAIAEAKLLESGVFLPSSANGGTYAISRIVPGTINSTLWGNDSDRFHQAIIVSGDPLTTEVRDEFKAKWKDLRGTGTYEQWAKDYLAQNGYTTTDTYTLGYTSEPTTWDALNTYQAADSEAIVNTYDGLFEYNIENEQAPALATSYEVSDDGLTYTFHIREGVKWVTNQGVVIEDLTAKSFVAAMQHMMDAQGGLEYLVDGIILNAHEYMAGDITDFSQVGVTAVDDYTLVYTLTEPCSYFTTMLGYNIFAPMSESFFLAHGGAFGIDAYAEAVVSDAYTYGTSPENIAYCGPYLVTSYAEKNSIVFDANPEYWNKDGINIHKLVWRFIDGQDPTEAYGLMKDGVFAGCGLNTNALAKAKTEGMFDDYAYVSSVDGTCFNLFLNVYRKAYANFNDETVAVSEMTEDQSLRANIAMQNQHFRLALCMGLDRGVYNAATVGDELKYTSLVNAYTPGTFVSLEEDVTVEINGTATTFPAGTFYGAIVQAQIDADGIKITAWDPEADGGIGSHGGFDGWYNVDNAREQLAIAVEELKAEGVVIDADNPIYLDLPYYDISEIYANRANTLKQSIEASLEGAVVINLVKTGGSNYLNWYNAAYYPNTGDQMNFNLSDVSGWGPDYGDPATYLDTMLPQGGGMAKSIGLF